MNSALTIHRKDDPRIAQYLDVRDRDLKAQSGAFVVEGEVVVRTLLLSLRSPESRYRVRSLLIEARRLAKLADALEKVPTDVPIYSASQEVMDGIVGFHIHRGVLALADRGDALDPRTICTSGAATLVALLGVVNHDNVGGIFRNAAAFGVGGVLLDGVTCDPLYRKAVRVSVGGALLVPFARAASHEAMLDELEREGYELIALTARGEEEISSLASADAQPGATQKRKRALLVGAEGPGLPEPVLAKCKRVRIAMTGALDSLNASVACGIALHAITRASL